MLRIQVSTFAEHTKNVRTQTTCRGMWMRVKRHNRIVAFFLANWIFDSNRCIMSTMGCAIAKE